ncbi:MAG: glycosyltransferase [Lachnospiraceae bacterium]|nr:glycosyltransferase [Lachnospiraceae bacterium]
MNPLVSVCIPAYNNAAYIKETIDSILNQTYRNFELIICDDRSGDNTVEVIKAIKDERITLYKNEKNLGMAGNWNNCLQKCNGEFIKLICADDLLAKNCLEQEVRALRRNPTAVFVSSDTKLLDLDGKPKGFYKRYKTDGLTDGKKIARAGFFVKNYFGAPLANMFRKSAMEKAGGFDPWYTYILDYDFWVQLACMGDVYIIHEPLNYFRVRNDSNTGEVMLGNKANDYVKEHIHLVNKFKQELNLSDRDINRSIRIRKLRNFAAGIYLKIFVRK